MPLRLALPLLSFLSLLNFPSAAVTNSVVLQPFEQAAPLNEVHELALDRDDAVAFLEQEHAEFREWWKGHLQNYLLLHGNDIVSDAPLLSLSEIIGYATKKGHIDLDWFRMMRFREQITKVTALGSTKQPQCPRYDGRVCNGEKSGKCSGKDCECIGGWSGIACQTDPVLKNYDPMTGSSEPTADCRKKLMSYMKQC